MRRLQGDSDLAGMCLGGTMGGIRVLKRWLLIGNGVFWGGEGEKDESEDWEMIGARLPVTQSDDPPAGGHFALGMSKTPLLWNKSLLAGARKWKHTPGPPENVVE